MLFDLVVSMPSNLEAHLLLLKLTRIWIEIYFEYTKNLLKYIDSVTAYEKICLISEKNFVSRHIKPIINFYSYD